MNCYYATENTHTARGLYECEEYSEWDEYDEQMFLTDKVLGVPYEAGKEYQRAYERYMRLRKQAEKVRGYEFVDRGKYGYHIFGDDWSAENLIMDMIEAHEQYDDKWWALIKAQTDLIALMKQCDTLSVLQRAVLALRHLPSKPQGYGQIARYHGLKDENEAWDVYKQGYVAFSEWLRKTGRLQKEDK